MPSARIRSRARPAASPGRRRSGRTPRATPARSALPSSGPGRVADDLEPPPIMRLEHPGGQHRGRMVVKVGRQVADPQTRLVQRPARGATGAGGKRADQLSAHRRCSARVDGSLRNEKGVRKGAVPRSRRGSAPAAPRDRASRTVRLRRKSSCDSVRAVVGIEPERVARTPASRREGRPGARRPAPAGCAAAPPSGGGRVRLERPAGGAELAERLLQLPEEPGVRDDVRRDGRGRDAASSASSSRPCGSSTSARLYQPTANVRIGGDRAHARRLGVGQATQRQARRPRGCPGSAGRGARGGPPPSAR